MRATDTSRTSHFRSERFFCSNNQWFFCARETQDQGPFKSREEAETELAAFLATEIGIQFDAWSDPTLRR